MQRAKRVINRSPEFLRWVKRRRNRLVRKAEFGEEAIAYRAGKGAWLVS